MEKVPFITEDQIALWVIKLNPGKAGIYSEPNARYIYINSSVPPEELVLPIGCYYNKKNGITNKHNTIEGFYATLKVKY